MSDQFIIREAVRDDFSRASWLAFDAMMPGLPDMAWNKRPVKMAVAEAGDKLVGMIVGHTVQVASDDPSNENPFGGIYQLEVIASGSWLIRCLGADRDWKNQGVERQLLEFAEGLADAAGATGLSVVFGRVRTDFVPFFEGEGFSVLAERDGLYSLGLPVTWVLMARENVH
ncbi:MAG: GCN5-related N-acetyltransferase [Devosia sp.]|uniref:hypothetical protein n=1 Tax=Devosia sp. TaxID=1871048 RepID=UPI0026148DF4|nr:hypothetical protein [Devosia sp.]MDB5588480.1 GCN5-related N-acetyltransferase [Devosia sp.]